MDIKNRGIGMINNKKPKIKAIKLKTRATMSEIQKVWKSTSANVNESKANANRIIRFAIFSNFVAGIMYNSYFKLCIVFYLQLLLDEFNK